MDKAGCGLLRIWAVIVLSGVIPVQAEPPVLLNIPVPIKQEGLPAVTPEAGRPLAPKPLVKPGQLDLLMSSSHVIAQTMDLLRFIAIAASGDRRVPVYASVGLGRDEYIYQLADAHFIRVIKGRYELPSWRRCGDWAQVRVEMFDESMRTIGHPQLWLFAFRDGQWRRIPMDEGGQFVDSQSQEIRLPPYAVRCLNLDKREFTDPVE